MTDTRTNLSIEELFKENGYDNITPEMVESFKKHLTQEQKNIINKRRAIKKANREKAMSNKERTKRTHQLCNIGGTVLSFHPEFATLSQDELYQIFERIFSFEFNENTIARMVKIYSTSNEGEINNG